jgi:ribonuclease HIII
MSNTKKLTPQEINNYLKDNKQYLVDKPNNPNIAYFFRKNNQTITVFKNGTLLIQEGASDDKFITTNYIGCDEVGVGDYFGGLVTCAVYLDKKIEDQVLRLGVRDSKQLSDEQMLKIYPKLIALVKYCVSSYEPEQYNEVIKNYKNTHVAKALLHDTSIKKLLKDLDKKVTIVMDAFSDAKNYYKYLHIARVEPQKIDRFETHAENKYLAVACASIIARVVFLKQIDELSKKVNKKLILGASNPLIIDIAKEIYRDGGMIFLNKVAKIDFATTKKVIG